MSAFGMMVTSAPNYTVARFSTSALQEPEWEKTLEELHERGLLATRFTPCGEALPRVDFANRIMPGLRILTATYAGVRHGSVPAKAHQQGADDLFLCVILTGTGLARRRGREVVLSDGDAVLMTSEEATWTFTSPSTVKVAGLRLSRSALVPLAPNLDDAVMRRISRDAAELRLLREYIGIVADDEALTAPASQRLITSHLYDLAALTLGAKYDEGFTKIRSVCAVRLAAIKADIVANLHDGNLSATMVATRSRVTVRYLHKLFENEGITYSEFVLSQRLARAYGILRNPFQSHRAISKIAFELGFNDLSYFNRTFRRRYNATPSDVRDGAGATAVTDRPTVTPQHHKGTASG